MSRLLAAALLVTLLAGCQTVTPAAPPSPEITPQVLDVQASPALRPLRSLMQGCAYPLPGFGLNVIERPASVMQPQAGLVLRWGAPAALVGFAVQIGSEELVVIVHPDNPLPGISAAQLAAVFALQTRAWDALGSPAPQLGQEIHPWAYNPGDDIQAIFEAAIGPIRADAAALAPDPDAMRQAVAADPGAIGFLPRRALDDSVKSIEITGLNADALTHPILVLAPVQPAALSRDWLVCLQERL